MSTSVAKCQHQSSRRFESRFETFHACPERRQLDRNKIQLSRVLLDEGVNAANSQKSGVGAIHISIHSERPALLEHLPQTRPPVTNKI